MRCQGSSNSKHWKVASCKTNQESAELQCNYSKKNVPNHLSKAVNLFKTALQVYGSLKSYAKLQVKFLLAAASQRIQPNVNIVKYPSSIAEKLIFVEHSFNLSQHRQQNLIQAIIDAYNYSLHFQKSTSRHNHPHPTFLIPTGIGLKWAIKPPETPNQTPPNATQHPFSYNHPHSYSVQIEFIETNTHNTIKSK